MPPHAAALPEGGDESMVMGLLEREDIRGLVAAARALQEEPPEASRKRLVILARQALERALDVAYWEEVQVLRHRRSSQRPS